MSQCLCGEPLCSDPTTNLNDPQDRDHTSRMKTVISLGIPVMLDMGSEGCCLIGTLIPTHKRTMLPLVDKHAS